MPPSRRRTRIPTSTHADSWLLSFDERSKPRHSTKTRAYFLLHTLKLQLPDSQSELNVHAIPLPSFLPPPLDLQTLKLQLPDWQSELNVHAAPFVRALPPPPILVDLHTLN